MKWHAITALALFITGTAFAADFTVAEHWPNSTGVFVAGRDHVSGHTDGVPDKVATAADMYQNYREPVAARTKGGRLVVLCHAGNRHAWPERSGQDLAVAFSDDGGNTWTALEPAPELKATQCNGSLLTLRDENGQLTNTLLCSLPTPGGRKDGVVYVSLDGGKSWPIRHNIVRGFFAYSSLVQVDRGTVALFYETNHYRDIRVMRLPVKRLVQTRN